MRPILARAKCFTFNRDRDVLTLTYRKRQVYANNMKAPNGHVITGVAFRKTSSGRLSLAARVSEQ